MKSIYQHIYCVYYNLILTKSIIITFILIDMSLLLISWEGGIAFLNINNFDSSQQTKLTKI